MTFIFTIIYTCVLLKIIISGHIESVKKSEKNLYAYYNKLGSSGEESRKLMREAGYKV